MKHRVPSPTNVTLVRLTARIRSWTRFPGPHKPERWRRRNRNRITAKKPCGSPRQGRVLKERVCTPICRSDSDRGPSRPSSMPLEPAVPSIYSIVPPNDGSALRHGHHFEPVDFVIDHGRGHHDAYSAGSCQRTYARACGCRQRPRCHREELIESEPGWSGREAFVTMMQTADLGQGNDRSGPGRLNGSSIRCVLAERQVGP